MKKDILVSTICAVERVDKNAFQRKNMLQVIQRLSDGELSTTYISTKASSNSMTVKCGS